MSVVVACLFSSDSTRCCSLGPNIILPRVLFFFFFLCFELSEDNETFFFFELRVANDTDCNTLALDFDRCPDFIKLLLDDFDFDGNGSSTTTRFHISGRDVLVSNVDIFLTDVTKMHQKKR